MRQRTRAFYLIFALILLLLPVMIVAAQDPPPPPFGGGDDGPGGPPTDDSSQPPFGDTGGPPGSEGGDPNQPPFGGGDAGPGGPQQPQVTEEPVPTAEPTAEPEAVPEEEETVTPDRATEIALAARIDLENLADFVRPEGRPAGWNGSTDITDPQMVTLLRLDLELLAGTMLGADSRPEGWFGAVPSTPFAFARDVRHDLEVLAEVLGRPENWTGGEPLLSCDRSTQAMVEFLENNGVFTLQADRTAPDFCEQAALEASLFMEVNLLANPADGGGVTVLSTSNGVNLAGAATVDSPYSAAFLDRSASRRTGVVPEGTSFEPVARSYAQFSNMMLIRGEGFEVWVDYQFTSITPEQFDALPDINTIDPAPTPACTADWCSTS